MQGLTYTVLISNICMQGLATRVNEAEVVHTAGILAARLAGQVTSPALLRLTGCFGHFPRKSVNLSFILVIMKDELTDLCGN